MKKFVFAFLLGFISFFATGQSIYFSKISFEEAIQKAKLTRQKIFVYIQNNSTKIEKYYFPRVSSKYNREYINLKLSEGEYCPNCKKLKGPVALYYSYTGRLIKGPISIRSVRDLE